MWNITSRRIFILIFLVGFPFLLCAENKRTIPLDMHLIIDGSSAMEAPRDEIVAWINEYVVDRVLMAGDRITIWTAAATARVIHSATISGDSEKREIRELLNALDTRSATADFSGAITDAASRLSADRSRLSYTMLITASAEGLRPAFTGSARHLFQWFRSEQFSRWQVLVIGPDIGGRVRQAAAAYMSSQR